MRIAIIGSGISGLGAAYYLQKEHEVTIFEKNNYLGGHTYTYTHHFNDKDHAIDTGFIVFNETTYPNFIKLLKKLNIKTQNTQMGFSFESLSNGFVYNGSSFRGLFCDKKNLLNFDFYKLIADFYRFGIIAKKMISSPNSKMTLNEFLDEYKFHRFFKDYYLIPLSSALWSTSYKNILDAPIQFIIYFLYNHSLLGYEHHLQWKTIVGGSTQYVKKLSEEFKKAGTSLLLNKPIIKIERKDKIKIIDMEKNEYLFDKVIIATHSDEILSILDEPTDIEQNIFEKCLYENNEVILHTDRKVLPKNKKAWAAWNYKQYPDHIASSTLTYYMNYLQNLDAELDYFVSLNQSAYINPEKIIAKFNYSHPTFSSESFKIQKEHEKIMGIRNTYYCGAYWGFGFHEDGLKSALKVCKYLGIEP
ncbi:MAG: NAD(P)/FAD-dependent oxidoreductase [Gammaproteobacteria bacterium]